ncbi:MAG: DNA polymerase III subunit [Armatimonadetes bacterium]|nr:DNA polymerase III subunit [Armatimonadota bacterium]
MPNPLFQSILGQPYAVSVLQTALDDGRLAGSYLFVGPDGVGKATTARQFANALCGAASEEDPLARAIDAGTSPDVRRVEPQGAGRMIRIGQLWPRDGDKDNPPDNAMLRDLAFEPIMGRKRVFILKDAEGLNESSGNSLLKTLEEPPPYAHFILTATSTAAVLPTIASRCQIVRFGVLPTADIEGALVERFNVAPAQARFLSVYSEGRLGRAVALARSPSLLAGRDLLLDFARDLVTAPPIKSFKLGEEFRKLAPKLRVMDEDVGEGGGGDGDDKPARASLLRALDLLATYYRDLLAIRLLGEKRAHPVNADRFMELAGAAERYVPAQLEEALALLLALRRAVERNANAQLAIEVLFTRLTTLTE